MWSYPLRLPRGQINISAALDVFGHLSINGAVLTSVEPSQIPTKMRRTALVHHL